MYLKTDKIIMTIDGITIYSHNEVPAPKYLFDPTALIGWTDGVDIKRNEQPRPTTDGDFAEEMDFSSRVIIATGTAIANTVQELHLMRDQFIKILSDKSYKPLSITDGAGTRYATVSLGNKTSWIQETDKTAVWKLELYAPDPYIYGEQKIVQTGANTSSGGLDYPISYPLNFNIIGNDTAQVLQNRGNATMWPVFVVRGEYNAGFTISNNNGKKVTYNGLVTQLAPVTINMAKGTATQSGIDKTYLITDRDWFSVPPYGTIQPRFEPIQGSSGWCDIVYQDTWI